MIDAKDMIDDSDLTLEFKRACEGRLFPSAPGSIPESLVLRTAIDTARAAGLNPEQQLTFACVALHREIHQLRRHLIKVELSHPSTVRDPNDLTE